MILKVKKAGKRFAVKLPSGKVFVGEHKSGLYGSPEESHPYIMAGIKYALKTEMNRRIPNSGFYMDLDIPNEIIRDMENSPNLQ